MITIEKIKSEFNYVISWIGNHKTYHNTDIYEGYGKFCDVYFNSDEKGIVLQGQVDTYNSFKENHKDYLAEIERFIISNLTDSERQKQEEIRKLELTFDVIEVPQNNEKYDLVLVSGKTYKSFIFFKNHINIRVELQSGKIKSIKRTKDSTKDNF